MAAAVGVSSGKTLLARLKAYHARHPIIVSYGIISAILYPYLIYNEFTVDQKMQCVSKYKSDLIIMRPDDPKVKMIKRGPIRMDY